MHFIIAKFLAEVGILFVETDPETEKTRSYLAFFGKCGAAYETWADF